MKRHLWPWRTVAILLPAAVLLGTVAGWAAPAAEDVRLSAKRFAGTVGQPVRIGIETPTKRLPGGFTYTVAADEVAYPGPDPPAILPGVPTTTVTCPDPGEYRLRIRVNRIKKTSCGCASFTPLLEEDVVLHITAR